MSGVSFSRFNGLLEIPETEIQKHRKVMVVKLCGYNNCIFSMRKIENFFVQSHFLKLKEIF